jgi:hypothetical protein
MIGLCRVGCCDMVVRHGNIGCYQVENAYGIILVCEDLSYQAYREDCAFEIDIPHREESPDN